MHTWSIAIVLSTCLDHGREKCLTHNTSLCKRPLFFPVSYFCMCIEKKITAQISPSPFWRRERAIILQLISLASTLSHGVPSLPFQGSTFLKGSLTQDVYKQVDAHSQTMAVLLRWYPCHLTFQPHSPSNFCNLEGHPEVGTAALAPEVISTTHMSVKHFLGVQRFCLPALSICFYAQAFLQKVPGAAYNKIYKQSLREIEIEKSETKKKEMQIF